MSEWERREYYWLIIHNGICEVSKLLFQQRKNLRKYKREEEEEDRHTNPHTQTKAPALETETFVVCICVYLEFLLPEKISI